MSFDSFRGAALAAQRGLINPLALAAQSALKVRASQWHQQDRWILVVLVVLLDPAARQRHRPRRPRRAIGYSSKRLGNRCPAGAGSRGTLLKALSFDYIWGTARLRR